jgi:lipopolysaccharide export system protein LptA
MSRQPNQSNRYAAERISIMRLTRLAKLSLNISLAFTVVVGSQVAKAERADRAKPMNIEASRADVDDTTLTRVLTGNVIITKGTILIRADKVTIKEDGQGNSLVTATGKSASFRQKREGLDQYIDASAETVEYDSKNDTVKLKNRAQLKRLEREKVADEVYGSQINYDGKTETYSVESGPTGQSSQNPSGRVRIVLQPKPEAIPKSPGTTDGKSPDAKPSEPRK